MKDIQTVLSEAVLQLSAELLQQAVPQLGANWPRFIAQLQTQVDAAVERQTAEYLRQLEAEHQQIPRAYCVIEAEQFRVALQNYYARLLNHTQVNNA